MLGGHRQTPAVVVFVKCGINISLSHYLFWFADQDPTHWTGICGQIRFVDEFWQSFQVSAYYMTESCSQYEKATSLTAYATCFVIFLEQYRYKVLGMHVMCCESPSCDNGPSRHHEGVGYKGDLL